MGVTSGLIFLSLLGVALGTSCSEPQRTTNLTQCLEAIGEAGFLDDVYWFGTQYSTNCPVGSMTLGCVNPRPQYTSIFTRVFTSGYDPYVLDRYLKIVYTSPPGSYSGCGNTYTFNETWTQEIDPLSDVLVTPWYVRNLPQLEWTADSTEMFSLIVYDVGNLYNHGVYVNIRGNDITTAQIIKPYHGPQRSLQIGNPYIFLLFKQSGTVSVSEEWRQIFEQNVPGTLSFSNLISQWSLTGPVALNWIVATGDVYAAGRMLNIGVLNACPDYVAEKLNVRPRPFLPTSPEFNVGVNVKFDVTPTQFSVCCSTHTYTQESFDLNPLGNPVYDTYKTSQKPTVTLMKKGLVSMATNFTGDLFTLVCVDPDVPVADVGTQQRPLLHWLVTNIPGGNVGSGIEYKPYMGPGPPDRMGHYYYFLLYKQDNSLSSNTFLPYAGSCPQSLIGRCKFNINGMVANENLTLVGASWMIANTDIYVAKRKVDDGQDINQWCTGMRGYRGDPSCPVGVSSRALGSSVLILVSLVMLLIC